MPSFGPSIALPPNLAQIRKRSRVKKSLIKRKNPSAKDFSSCGCEHEYIKRRNPIGSRAKKDTLARRTSRKRRLALLSRVSADLRSSLIISISLAQSEPIRSIRCRSDSCPSERSQKIQVIWPAGSVNPIRSTSGPTTSQSKSSQAAFHPTRSSKGRAGSDPTRPYNHLSRVLRSGSRVTHCMARSVEVGACGAVGARRRTKAYTGLRHA